MTITKYLHACDASAAGTIGDTSLFAAASDEGCALRVYDRSAPGAPISELDVATFLERDDPDDFEADIEGVAQLGDRMYWIGSHGRSRKGKERKNRQRLFATLINPTGGSIALQFVGRPYKRLLSDLATAPTLAMFDLATAATKKPEEPGGLNIEGLAPTPEGHLLIGFRNPIPEGRALIVRLSNPGALIDGTETAADATLAGLLDLGGRGIRALEFVPARRLFLILAGALNDDGNFQLFAWPGDLGSPARPLTVDMGGLNPEEMVVVSDTAAELTLHLLSDDGTDACKESAPDGRSFRALTVRVAL